MINWYCPQGDTNNTYLMRYDERGEKHEKTYIRTDVSDGISI